MVYMKKKNKHIHACVNFSTGLNECLKTYEYLLPSAEDIFAKLNSSKVFSKLDFPNVDLKVMIDEETLKMLTINTHRSSYCFNHLPFRCKVASNVFQKIMDMLAELDFTLAYLNNILIKSETFEQHRLLVKEVCLKKKIDELGFKLSVDKCEFYMLKIKYLEQIIITKGQRPNLKRLSAIQNTPAPTNIAELQAFLGLANYDHVYINNIHDLHALLNEQLKKEKRWN